MKKFFIMLLVAVLTLFTFVGCTPQNPVESDTGSSQSSTGETPVEPTIVEKEINLTKNETYNLTEQLKYETYQVGGLKFAVGDKNYTLISDTFEGTAVKIEKGVITPNATEPADKATDQITFDFDEVVLKITINYVNYEKYGDTLSAPDVGRLFGKRAIFFGDSITDENAAWLKSNTWQLVDKTGKYIRENGRPKQMTGVEKNYVQMLNEICKFSAYQNPAIAGALCAYYNAAYANKAISIPTQINSNLTNIQKADYVFLMVGTNDSYEINKSGGPLQIGTVADMAGEEAFDNSVSNKPLSTFCGFYNWALNKIRTTNPNATLICLSNIPCQSSYGGNGANGHNNAGIQGVNAKIVECAQKFSARYVDIYSAIPIDEKAQVYSKVWFTNDELHPNMVAYELITDKILSAK